MKNVNWLPTMATRWEKQLSLQKERIQIRTSKRISTQNNNEKIVLTSSSTILFSDVSKDANQKQS
jgi:hypothetical protein